MQQGRNRYHRVSPGLPCFFEVKYRNDDRFGTALEAVGSAKQEKICRCADWYLWKHPAEGDVQIRFDVVAVCRKEIQWIQNAFEYRRSGTWEQQGDEDSKKDLIRKKTGYPGMEIHKSGEVEYLTFPALERLNIVTHMVTSRFGGVSTGDCASFNFSYARDTSREAVDENFRRAAGVFGTTSDAFVCSDQTHTTNIRRVEKEDAGKGVTKEKDYRDVDGLITNVPGLILGTFYADCVPLFVCRSGASCDRLFSFRVAGDSR